MKRVIALALTVVLCGCDQNSQATAEADKPAVSPASTAAPAAAVDGPKASVYQFGLYKAVKKGRIVDSADTDTGKIVLKPTLELAKTTDHVPLVKDTYFGYQYRLFKLPPEAMVKPVIKLRKVLIHPEMTLPNGSKVTGWDQTFNARVESQQVMGFDGYGLNEDYELVEGDWIFQLWYKDKKLIERKFITYHPQQNADALAAAKAGSATTASASPKAE